MGSSDKRPPPAAGPPNELILAPVATAAHRSLHRPPYPVRAQTHTTLTFSLDGRSLVEREVGRKEVDSLGSNEFGHGC